jgi:hypothetical protein
MRKLALLTLLCASLGVFAIGCQKAAEKPAETTPPPADTTTPPPAEGEKAP